MSRRKSTHRRKALPAVGIALGVTTVAAVAYSEVITSVVARRRSDRRSRISARCTGKKREAAQDLQVRTAAEQLREVPTEEVTLVNREGLTLRAHWYHAEAPRRMLIMVHGWHSSWYREFGSMAPFYHEQDCELLLIEQRCHGDSEGDMISYGDRERYDVLEWLTYAAERYPQLPIYLCGVSMGAATVLLCAGEPIGDRVTGIIADCGYTVPRDVVEPSIRRLMGRATGLTMVGVELCCRAHGGFSLNGCSTLEALRKNKQVPVFFVHGDADDLVPYDMTLQAHMACVAPSELLLVHGAGHASAFLTDPETYRARVSAFFEKWDERLAAAPTDMA